MYPFFKDIFISDYHSELFHKSELTPKRITADYEIEFYNTENGFAYVDGKAYEHKIGNVLFAQPNQMRHSRGRFSCYSVHFVCDDKSLIKELFTSIPTCCYLPESEPLFRELMEIPSKPRKTFLIHAHAVIMQIISKIHEAYPQSDMEEASLSSVIEIKKICDYIKGNFTASDITIEELYKNTFMSRSSFFTSFKSVTGLTPSTYINAVRVEHAKKLLRDTDKPLSYIASECGFGSQSYFCSVFRAQTNMTPLACRSAHFAEIEKRYR